MLHHEFLRVEQAPHHAAQPLGRRRRFVEVARTRLPFRGAPMSAEYLNDNEPDMSWQKGLNDFAKRDQR